MNPRLKPRGKREVDVLTAAQQGDGISRKNVDTIGRLETMAKDPMDGGEKLARAAQVITILVGTTASAYFAHSVVIPILLALIASMALNPPNAWLKRHLPAPIAAAVVVALLVIPGGTAAYYLGLPAVEWVKSAPEKLPQLRDRFQHILRPAAQLSAAASSVSSLGDSDDKSRKNSSVEIKDNHVASSVVFWTGSFLGSAGETLALLFLMLASGQDLVRNFVRVLPTLRDRKRAADVVQEIQHSISNYLFAVSLINLGFGIAVGASLYSLGRRFAIGCLH